MGGHNKAKAAKLISTMAIKLQLNGDIKTTAAIVNRANELFKNSNIKKVRGINQYMDKTKISDAKAAACMYIRVTIKNPSVNFFLDFTLGLFHKM